MSDRLAEVATLTATVFSSGESLMLPKLPGSPSVDSRAPLRSSHVRLKPAAAAPDWQSSIPLSETEKLLCPITVTALT